ncbi:MAG: hypothetical protein IKS13_08880 [Ruminococcus sp.]|nr:hypothetical protein [Ruminococcus sp.]
MEINDLKCPSCGAEVHVPEKCTYSIFCQYCGSKLRLDFTGHTVHLFDDTKIAEIEQKHKLLDISDEDLTEFHRSKNIWTILLITTGLLYAVIKLLTRFNMDYDSSLSATTILYYCNDAFLLIALILLTLFRPKAPKNIKGVHSVSWTVILIMIPIIFIADFTIAILVSMMRNGE